MEKRIKIVPTLLTHSFTEFKEKLKKVEPFFNLVQIDIMDNKFVKNKTFYEVHKVRKLKSYKGFYELHLMTLEPLKIIKQWERFKKVKKIIFHYEAMKNDQEIFDLIEYIQKKGIKAGLAINPETPFKKFEKILPKVDVIFFLGVNPGWGGQTLKQSVLNKVKQVRKKYPKLDIEIDGGVNMQNIKKAKDAGVNIISAGTMLFKDDIKTVVKEVKDKLV